MSDDYDTVLVEFRCPLAKARGDDSPVKNLTAFLQRQKRGFAVEESTIKKEDVAGDPEWIEWLAENSTGYEDGIFLAVFLVSQKDRAYFGDQFEEYISERRREHEKSG